MKISAVIYSLFLMAGACSPNFFGSKSSTTGTYDEDLSSVRPKVVTAEEVNTQETPEDTIQQVDETIVPENDVTEEVNKTMNAIIDLNKGNIHHVYGYSIQVYSGPSRSDAIKAKGKARMMLPEAKIKDDFYEVSFKVKVGQFYSRLEAHKSYSTLRKSFPDAILVVEKIPIPTDDDNPED